MARLAIVVLGVFWAIVTAGSLVWEVVDPATVSAEQPQQALPPGLTGERAGAPAQPTLAELTPGLRAELQAQIAERNAAVPPIETPSRPEGTIVAETPRTAERVGGEAAGAGPAKEAPLADSVQAERTSDKARDYALPRPRPKLPPPALAPQQVKVPEARPGVAPRSGDARVAEAQSLLGSLGYRVGTVDGRMGPQTMAAIKAYEKKGGLKVDGRVDDQLLARLRADARTASLESAQPTQAAAAPAAKQSLTGRVLGGVQRVIGHDLNSVVAPERLAEYCDTRTDEWIYDRGLDKMRSCAEVVGKPVAFRALPGDR
jgi:Putative peptidoglycan-binding domain-containing protein